MTKYLIVNADDLGISIPVNLAICRAFRDGIVSSASLMANMPAFRHAAEEVIRPNPGLGVGIHLCVTSGPPVLPPERVPLLVSGCQLSVVSCQRAKATTDNCQPTTAQFRRGFVGLWRLLHSSRREEALRQIGEEWAAQVQRAEALGVAIDHLDGHQHVHMIPGLFDLAAGLARTRKIAIRVAGESFRLRQRGAVGALGCLANGGILKNAVLAHFAKANRRRWPSIWSTDHYFGALDTGRMSLDRLQSILRSLPDGISEVTVHPGSCPLSVVSCQPQRLPTANCQLTTENGLLQCNPQDRRFLRRRQAAEELAALVDPTVREMLAAKGIKLVRFQDLPDCR